ncbi:sensor histidine kinase [Arthrobacter sp. NPDC058130]|uniref:sensor histidine kinase n=1 Tax=Arthrobacter sp. NPDC058130 TaxID=3346353 RepID=UPI0036E28417
METALGKLGEWSAPLAGTSFGLYWFHPYFGFLGSVRIGMWPIPAIALLTLAIATAGRWPRISLAFVAVLLSLQLLKVISPMTSVMWQVHIGSFIALAFILWKGKYRVHILAIGMNLLFAGAMAFLTASRQYGSGGSWFRVSDLPNEAMVSFWWHCLSVLIVIATGFGLVGLSLRLFEERRGLFQAAEEAQASLQRAEIELVVEQERRRISRDFHDVLAHSLAVIAAQADGARYLHPNQPESVNTSLKDISTTARTALVDLQRVIDSDSRATSEDVQPNLAEIPTLVRRTCDAGMDVHLGDRLSHRT